MLEIRSSFVLAMMFTVSACGWHDDADAPSLGTTESAVITNGGFETGNLTGWTVSTFLNSQGLAAVPPTAVADLRLGTGGRNFTAARTASPPGSQVPSGLTAGPGVPLWPRLDTTSVAINEYGAANPPGESFHQGANQNVNSIKQSFTTSAADVDPADGQVHVRFVLAPELEAAGHVPTQQPYFFVVVRNLTAPRAGDIYTNFNFSNQPGVPWQQQGTGATAMLFTDWQIFDIAPPADKFLVGDTLEVEVFAAGCEPGGHSGTVWVDGFGSRLPGLSIFKSAPDSANINSDYTYTFTVQNNSAGNASQVVADEILPRNTVFRSLVAPGATCTTPPVDATGTIACTYATMSPGASNTFQVTVHNHAPLPQGTGTATAATTTTLTDSGQTWTPNAFAGATVYITSGAGAGQQATILSNTATVLTLTPAFATAPTGATFLITNPPGTNVTAPAAVSAATSTTLTAPTSTWTPNQWAGWSVSILTGTGAGQQRTITASTANQLTVTPAWTTDPNATSTFVIGATGTSGTGQGTATGGTTTTLTDSSAHWTTGQYLNWTVTILSGTGAGQQRTIIANTANQLTVSPNWTTRPNGTSTYAINVPIDTVTNGNYGVASPTTSRLLGPKRETTISSGISLTDLQITKDDGVPAIAPNGSTTYQITVVNNGPTAVNNAVVTDVFPAAIATHAWTCTATGGGHCDTANGTTNINHTVDLPVGATATFTVNATISATSGQVANVAQVATPAGIVDSFPDNNSDADIDDVGQLFPLTLAKDPADNGTGRVTSQPAGIDCATACQTEAASYVQGTLVTLQAVADAGSAFVGWTGDCSGSATTCTVTMSQARAVVARFTTCGNGVLDVGEGCDDGNRNAGDGCNATCKVEDGSACNAVVPGLLGDPSCASGICDPSGGGAGVCEAAGCGDGRLEAGESCDDGNATGGDGCNAVCKIENGNACGAGGDPSCASGVCDTSGGGAGVCEAAGCGDGRLEAGESCDDGNATGGDGCNAVCKIENGNACGAGGDPSCASGVCDTSGGGAGVCEAAGCGDGRLEAGESCDDGNAIGGDGCNAVCTIENGNACGAGGDTSCASGICDPSGGGTGLCEAPGCGDGRIEAGESCDDGGTLNGDGCNAV
jgi:uncharacterized repeat protein (TIGR01451 family)